MKRGFFVHLIAVFCAFGMGERLRAETYTTNILDGITFDAGGRFTVGESGPFNLLLITNSGALTNTIGTVGDSADSSNNLALLTGAGSVWQNTSNFIIGANGSLNRVSVLDGGRLNASGNSYLGFDFASRDNLLVLSGTNSTLDIGSFFVGYAGTGNQIMVTNSGRFISNRNGFNDIGYSESSSENLLLVTGPGSFASTATRLRVGYLGPRNTVIIRDGAKMTNAFATLGREASSFGNRAMLVNTGSEWHVQFGFVYIGLYGHDNQLIIADGGTFRVDGWPGGSSIIGVGPAASNNVVSISGRGSSWTDVLGILTVGTSGQNNSLRLDDHAQLLTSGLTTGSNSSGNQTRITGQSTVCSATVAIGRRTDANQNLLLLDGPGTLWTNVVSTVVGDAGSNNLLIITNGAQYKPRICLPPCESKLWIGAGESGRGNRLVVVGANSGLSITGPLIVGSNGPENKVLVADGAQLSCGSTIVGVSGQGNGLIVSNRGAVVTSNLTTSSGSGRKNTIVVDGSNSLLQCAGGLLMSGGLTYFSNSDDRVFVLNGGRMESGVDQIRGQGNVMVVSGSGSSWSNYSLSINNFDYYGFSTNGYFSNLVTVADGGRVDSSSAVVGVSSTRNSALVTDPGTTWNISTNLYVGVWSKSNCLSVLAGGQVFAQNLFIGASNGLAYDNLGMSNLVWIEGTNSLLGITSNLFVGFEGASNHLEIRSGAVVNDQNGSIGDLRLARYNSAIITGPGAVWDSKSNLFIGHFGYENRLTVSKGGAVRTVLGTLGLDGVLVGQGGSCVFTYGGNRVLISDPGSIWENRGELTIGDRSVYNFLTVSNSASLLAGRITIGQSSGGLSGECLRFQQLNILTIMGGCVIATNATENALLEARFGVLRLLKGRMYADRFVADNGALSQVEFQAGRLQVRDLLVNNGKPLVIGDGFHSANLQIERLSFMDGFGNLTASSRLYIQPHSVLSGRGRVIGSSTNAGTIAPGWPLQGSLLFRDPLYLAPSSNLRFDIGGKAAGTDFDCLGAAASIQLDGALRLSLRNNFVPVPTDVFNIINFATRNGVFTNAPDGARLKTTDNLGSFLVTYTSSQIQLSDYQTTDTDGDGIEDDWAIAKFGHSPLTPGEKIADADTDGMSNYEEFLAGTDPNDPGSVLRLSVYFNLGVATLEFSYVEGKCYHIWFTDDLGSWREVSDFALTYPQPGHCQWTDDGTDTGGQGWTARFYRLTVE